MQQEDLCMRSFKKVLLLIVALILMEKICTFALEPVTYTYYLEKDLHKLAQQGKEPDVVLVGDSRIYRSFVPSIMDEMLGDGTGCTINTGTGSQAIRESYFYLKDLIHSYPVKTAIVELTYNCFLEGENESTLADMLVFDRMQSPLIKVEYLFRTFDWEKLPNVLKSYRYRGNMVLIGENVRTKLDENTRKGIDTREGERYGERGFVWTDPVFEDGMMGFPQLEPAQWQDEKVSEQAFAWLDRIRLLCEENGVELILVTGPTSLATIYAVEDYEGSYQCFSEYAETHGVPYFELNLLRDRQEILPDSLMRDSDHVCGAGAEVISEIFCRIIDEHRAGQDTSHWFYDSVAEMKQAVNAVVACDFHTEEIEGSADRMILAQSLAENGVPVEYEFLVCRDPGRDPEAQEWELFQSYGSEETCRLPGTYLEQDVRMRVNCRLVGSEAPWEAFMERTREVSVAVE